MSEKTTSRKSLKVSEPEMKATYDFSGAVRGKYFRRYLEGTNVVVLEPDVAKRFKNSAVGEQGAAFIPQEFERHLTRRYQR